MAGLDRLPDHFVIESTQPVRIEFAAENISKGATIKPEAKTASVSNNHAIAKIIPEQTVTEMMAKNDADRVPVSEAVKVNEKSERVAKRVTDNDADRESVNELSERVAKRVTDNDIDREPIGELSNLVTKTMADADNDVSTCEPVNELSDLVTKTTADIDNTVATPELSEDEESEAIEKINEPVANPIAVDALQISAPDTKP
jgi:hypothetical protein